MASGLTQRQIEVLAAVDHYHESIGEAAPASYVARKLAISKQRVQEYFRGLSELGWLRSAGSPAIPTRRLPPHAPPLTIQQLPSAAEACDVPTMAKRTAQVPSAVPAAQMIEMGPMVLRAEVRADKIDVQARTAEVVFSTGAGVERLDWWTGKRYIETLSLEPGHVRLKRINNSAPLLDAHSSYELRNQIGVVVPKTARIEGTQALATVRFSKRADVEPLFGDVVDGIVRNVSVGYKVHKYEITAEEGKPELRHATDWEPYEISAVPMGADDGAKFRGQKPTDTNPCQIVTRGGVKENKMDPEETPSETIVEDDPPTPTKRAAPAPEPNEHDEGKKAERARVQGILLACRAARLPQSFADKLIADDGVSLVEAQTRVFRELAARGGDDRSGRMPTGPEVTVGDDPFVHKRKGIENALLHRSMPPVAAAGSIKAHGFELTEEGRDYRGLGLMDMADIFLRSRGVRVTSMTKTQRATAALQRIGGMHTISDFPNLLADVMNKVLRAAYEAQPPTWGPIAKDVPLADFKPTKQLQIGDAPALLEVMEHGEFTAGTIAEGKEQFQLKTYGRIFAITRQAIINDDLNAFADVPAAFGRMARVKESDLAWAEITNNAAMGDGVVLFHATHANLDTVAAAIAVAPIGKGRAAMRVQKGLDLVTLLNLNPSYLIVPAAIETVADQFVSNSLMASAPGSVNPFAGRLQVISEPRLDANSVTAWYLATAVTQSPALFHGTLDGQPGPEVTQEQGFDVDGIRMKARIDVAFKAADFHGLWKNPGV